MKFEQFREEWKQLYEEGNKSLREIASMYNTTLQTVKRTLHGYVEFRPKSEFDVYAEEWLRLYQEGYSRQEIADKYHATYTIVYRVLKKMGVFPNTEKKLKYAHLTEIWKKQYREGCSLREIGEKSGGIAPETVRQYLEREGVETRSLSEAIRQYDIHESYFDLIDSKEKAYHLGLVFGIGTVIHDVSKYFLNLSVQKENMVMAQKIVKVLGATSMYERDKGEGKGEITFRYHSHHLYQTLCGYGLLPNKDKASTFPKLEKKYLSAFTLGYWEGRGTFPRSTRGYIKFDGSPLLLEVLKNHLMKIAPNEDFVIDHEKEKDSYALRITKSKVYLPVLDWMYADNPFYTKIRVPPFYENKKMGIQSLFLVEIYGREKRMVDFVSLKKRTAFELKLIEIQPVLTEHFQKESVNEKIYVFQNQTNGRLFKWKTIKSLNVVEGKTYTFYADISGEENGVIWFYRVLFTDFQTDKTVYMY